MTWWQALILGIVQGASEFLPISSSGHLLLLEKLGVGQESLFFNIMVHVGTLLAVLIAMRRSWMPLLRRPIQKTTGYILLACVPTVALALIFKYLAFAFHILTLFQARIQMTYFTPYDNRILRI